jgi:CDP-glucose 4,6-dehydratase
MMNLFSNVYENKTILVTGHTGFKGSWLSLWLKNLGAKVIGYSLPPPTDPSLFTVARISEGMTHIEGDIRDSQALTNSFQAHQPEMVFHLAAQPLVRQSYKNPEETYSTNIMGTVHLLEAIRKTKSVRVCVNVTSDKCYDNKEWDYAYRENDPMGGYDPYSSSKGAAELVASAYRRSFFNPENYKDHQMSLVSVRAGNVIGGGDWAFDRLIPDIIRSLSQKKSVEIRNPASIRPWQHVLDPLSGYLWLGSLLWQNPTQYDYGWNFGPLSSNYLTVKEIVEESIALWGKGEWKKIESSSHEAQTLKLDCTKAATLLDWSPVYDMKESLVTAVSWYRAFYHEKKSDPLVSTQTQLEEYVQTAKKQHKKWAQEQ